MELNGFMMGPEIKTLFKIKVGALIAEHPVVPLKKGKQPKLIFLCNLWEKIKQTCLISKL